MHLKAPPQRVRFTSPIGRGRIASAIRVRGYGLPKDRTPSPIEAGYIRLRPFQMLNSGKPELSWSGGAPSLLKHRR
jgi:hypothetical protein